MKNFYGYCKCGGLLKRYIPTFESAFNACGKIALGFEIEMAEPPMAGSTAPVGRWDTL